MTDSEKFSPEFRAAQIAGSIRLSGGRVSEEDEEMMVAILKGKVDPKVRVQELVEEIKLRSNVAKS